MAEYLKENGYPERIPKEVIFSIPEKLHENIRRIKYRQLQKICDKDARVVSAKTNEIKKAVDVIESLDFAMGVIMKKVLRNPEKIVEDLKKADAAIDQLNEITRSLCSDYGIRYKEPASLRKNNQKDAEQPHSAPKKNKKVNQKTNMQVAVSDIPEGLPPIAAAQEASLVGTAI